MRNIQIKVNNYFQLIFNQTQYKLLQSNSKTPFTQFMDHHLISVTVYGTSVT